ncbi:MAG: terminase large subunit, partial [Pirellulales bacterium]
MVLAPVLSPVAEYAEKVISGEIVAGKLVRLACKRHMRDLEEGPKRGLRWDDDAAQHAIDFFENVLKLTDGAFAGQPFILQPFQKFIVGSVFGWKGADGYRRFRTAYVEASKGAGKSPMAAGIGLYGLTLDHEAGAEIYAAAVTRDQAKILFADAEKMAQGSDDLAKELEFTVNNIAHPSSQSYFRAISAEARALDGKRVHMALIDEVHEHPNAMVVDKMRAGTKNRRQALIFEITNSGYDRNSVCYQHHVYSQQILEGIVENDDWFSYICQLDACGAEGHRNPVPGCADCDDWTDESVWLKVQPGLDTIMPRKYMREQVAEALGMPSKLNIVLRLNFCVWTESANRWLGMDAWDQCADQVDPLRLRSRACWLGIDLSSTTDLTAAALVFEPDAAGIIDVLM